MPPAPPPDLPPVGHLERPSVVLQGFHQFGAVCKQYVVIGHAPRHLDLNVTLVGRVVEGMDMALAASGAACGYDGDSRLLD